MTTPLIEAIIAADHNIIARTGVKARHFLLTRDQFNVLRQNLPWPEAKHLHDHFLLDGRQVIILEGPVVAVGLAQVWASGSAR